MQVNLLKTNILAPSAPDVLGGAQTFTHVNFWLKMLVQRTGERENRP
jgi:hypothetical protein